MTTQFTKQAGDPAWANDPEVKGVETRRTMTPVNEVEPSDFIAFFILTGVTIGADRDPIRMLLCAKKSLA
jgi:hypothetical protein